MKILFLILLSIFVKTSKAATEQDGEAPTTQPLSVTRYLQLLDFVNEMEDMGVPVSQLQPEFRELEAFLQECADDTLPPPPADPPLTSILKNSQLSNPALDRPDAPNLGTKEPSAIDLDTPSPTPTLKEEPKKKGLGERTRSPGLKKKKKKFRLPKAFTFCFSGKGTPTARRSSEARRGADTPASAPGSECPTPSLRMSHDALLVNNAKEGVLVTTDSDDDDGKVHNVQNVSGKKFVHLKVKSMQGKTSTSSPQDLKTACSKAKEKGYRFRNLTPAIQSSQSYDDEEEMDEDEDEEAEEEEKGEKGKEIAKEKEKGKGREGD